MNNRKQISDLYKGFSKSKIKTKASKKFTGPLESKLLLIPIDNRPCNTSFPQKLGLIYGKNISIPPRQFLGSLDKPASLESIYKWFSLRVNNSFGILASSDTLIYGGLVQSRKSDKSFEELKSNLKQLSDIKRKNKHLTFYLFGTILRISNNNENAEEKLYWKDYGELLYKYSYLLDKYSLVDFDDYVKYKKEHLINPRTFEKEILEIRKQIPEEILDDYISSRLRNFRINNEIIKLVAEGLIDFFAICVDDSGEKGLNVVERKLIEGLIKKVPTLKEKVFIYPGTDEALSLLLTRYINKQEDFSPTYYLRYSKPKSAFLTTKYEGVALKETIKSQIELIGGNISTSDVNADATLYFHTSEGEQEDQYLNALYRKETKEISAKLILSDVANIKKSINKNIVLVDVAFANGGHHRFVNKLSKEVDLKMLLSYSAWNTAGNSIGTALAHSNLRVLSQKKGVSRSQEKAHYSFLFERLIDDWLYQGFTRIRFIESTKDPYNEQKLVKLKNILENVSNKFLSIHKDRKVKGGKRITDIKLEEISFPWKRIFEIEAQCSVEII